MYMKRLFAALFLTVFCFPVTAQTATYPYGLSLRAHYGFIYQHKLDMDQLVSGHIPAFEISYRYNHSGKKEWEKFYRYPYSGVALQYLDFNNRYLGKAVAVIPYLAFPLQRKPRLDLFLRVGWGLGYVTQAFDIETNRKNTAISSHLNAAINLLVQYQWRVLPGMELMAGLSLTHFSNGAFKIPNAGVNVLGVNAGFNVSLGKPVPVEHNSFPIVSYGWRFLLSDGLFVKETDPVNRRKFLANTLSLNALKRYSRKASFGAGLDMMYDGSLNERNRYTGDTRDVGFRVGISLDYELHMGRWGIPLQQGVYVFDRFKKDMPFYQRIGWRYHARKNMSLNLLLKSHFFRADYIEAGFGYYLK